MQIFYKTIIERQGDHENVCLETLVLSAAYYIPRQIMSELFRILTVDVFH